MPPDIEAYRVKLDKTHANVLSFGRTMDGYFFGIGIDGPIGLLPVVGDVIGGITTIYLLSKTAQVHVPAGERLMILGLGIADAAIGLYPGIGDMADFFFRAHAWGAKHVPTQIEQAEHRLGTPGLIEDEAVVASHLRDALFRGGKTQQQVWLRVGAVAAVCLALLGY